MPRGIPINNSNMSTRQSNLIDKSAKLASAHALPVFPSVPGPILGQNLSWEKVLGSNLLRNSRNLCAIFCSQRVVTNAFALATADTMARFRDQICLTPDCAQPIFCSNLVPLLLEDLFPKLINNQSGRTGLTNFRI